MSVQDSECDVLPQKDGTQSCGMYCIVQWILRLSAPVDLTVFGVGEDREGENIISFFLFS